jgi:hypothetical protein
VRYKGFAITGVSGKWYARMVTATAKWSFGPYRSLSALHSRIDENYIETCTFEFV